jgi:hypothetical protein
MGISLIKMITQQKKQYSILDILFRRCREIKETQIQEDIFMID